MCARCRAKGSTCRYAARFTFVPIDGRSGGKKRNEDVATALQHEEETKAPNDVERSQQIEPGGPSSSLDVSLNLSLDPLAATSTSSLPPSAPPPATATESFEAGITVDAILPGPNEPRPDTSTATADLAGPIASTSRTRSSSGSHSTEDYLGLGTAAHNRAFFAIINNPASPNYEVQKNRWRDGRTRLQGSSIEAHCRGQILNEPIISLLCVFRYDIAGRLDLGLSPAFWGVHILQRSTQCVALLEAILSLARCLQHGEPPPVPAPVSATLNLDATAIGQEAILADDDRLAADLLNALGFMLCTSPRDWLPWLRSRGLDQRFQGQGGPMQQLWTRMLLSAALFDGSLQVETFDTLTRPHVDVVDQHRSSRLTHALQHSMVNLWNSIRFCISPHNDCNSGLTVADTWLTLWNQLQDWYASRTDEARPLLDSADCTTTTTTSPDTKAPIFPPIIFSTTAALMANTAHHLAAVLLLCHKPVAARARCPPPEGRSGPLSPSWYALRISSIAESAAEDGFWDPLLVAALVKCSGLLSHGSQLTAVLHTLRAFSQLCPVRLDLHMAALEQKVKLLDLEF